MEFTKCSEVMVDWYYTTDGGEDYGKYMVGKNDVKEILYHEPTLKGDKHYCDIYFINGTKIREFNLNYVKFME